MSTYPASGEWSTSSFYGKWTYSAANAMLRRGTEKTLQFEDMMQIPTTSESTKMLKTLKRCYKKSRKFWFIPRLMMALFRMAGYQVFIVIFFTLVESAIRVSLPVVLIYLLTSLQQDKGNFCYVYAAILGGLGILQTIVHHTLFYFTMKIGWNWKNATTAFIHDRLFYLNAGKLQASNTSSGMLVNLISNDVSRFEEFSVFACYIWESPLEISAVLIVLCFILNVPSAFAGVACSILLMPALMYISKLFAKYRSQTARATDQRVRYISEMIDGIASVKSYAWETPFFYLVRKFRNAELNVIGSSQRLRAVNQGVMFSTSSVASFATFAVYWGIGGTLTIPKVFATLSLLLVLRTALGTMFVRSIERGSESIASCHRIEAFLNLVGEVDDDYIEESRKQRSGSASSAAGGYTPVSSIEMTATAAAPADADAIPFSPVLAVPGPLVTVARSSYYYGSDPARPSLADVQLSVSRGEILVVVGPVGCGKSSLLAAVLGEMSMVPDNSPSVVAGETKRVISPNTTLAYCAQRPWILASSVKSNIALAGSHGDHVEENFKRPKHVDTELYTLAVESCLIVDDMAQWPAYDDTEVGERGVSVSGGQKARISLARAVYSDADLCILDDPLSAVDAHVGKALFFRCIEGALKKRGKGVILVTHQLQYMKHADKVLVLSKDGVQTFYGSYDDLLKNGEVLSTLELSPESAGASETADKELDDIVKHTGPKYDPNFRAATMMKMKSYVETEADKKRRNVVEVEQKAEGEMSWRVYIDYLRAGGTLNGIIVMTMMVLAQVVSMIADYWLRWWASAEFGSQSQNKYVGVFAMLMVLTVILGFYRALLWFRFTLKASANLHDNCMWAVMHSPQKFFISNPTGRILNRFAKDQNLTDEFLPITFFDFVQCFFFCLSAVILVCISIPWLILLFPFLGYAFMKLRHKYIENSREIKRIEAVTRSPIYADFSSTLEGLSTLRAYNLEERVAHLFQVQIDENGRAYFSFLMVSRWLGFRLDMLAALLVTLVAFFSVILRNTVDIGLIGFTLVYTVMLSSIFQWTVRQSAEVETQMTSLERINTYGQLPPEEGYTTTLDMVREQLARQSKDTDSSVSLDAHTKENIAKAARLNASKQGKLELVDLTVKYRLDLDPVLSRISVSIPAGSKVGICGRTGSGKSSTLLALLRLNIITEGDILLDGQSLLREDLETARSLVSIIPQEPHLFSGTVRFNLDPFSIYTDEEIWSALRDAHIQEYISKDPLGLGSKVDEAGKNFSVGQRQLLSLARAILRRCKVVLMDEVTASIDFLTDRLIQETIRTSPALKDSTIVTVAHRLRTIADSDLIVVIQAGELVEQGQPRELLTQPQSYFRKLAEESNEFDEIARIANKQ